jgi:putative FmdB family regulatory protein
MDFKHFSGTRHGRLTEAKGCLTFLCPAFWMELATLDAERQMPIYEYECQSCGHCFEEWQKMSDKPVKVCPKCKARKVEKLISHTSFQLKGGGWYSDLYASQKPGSGSAESSGAKAEPAGATKSDSSKSGDKPGGEKAVSEKSSSTPTASESKGKGTKGASKAA